MASVRNMVETRLSKIEDTVQELREQLDEGDFEELVKTADNLGKQGDDLANKLQKVSDSLAEEEEAGGEEEEDEDEDEDEEETTSSKKKKATASK